MEIYAVDDKENRTAERLIAVLRSNIEKVIIGKPEVIAHAVVAVLSGGHLLIEDVPGVGKSTLASALAKSVGASFMRIQFTSDMLPSDIIGISLFRKERGEFEFIPGPIFHNFVLADEINRASPRTQSALLEAMSDGQVSVENITHVLPRPFIIMATQNPQEYHGTYPLPESQLDRFMMTLEIGYPGEEDETVVLKTTHGLHSRLDAIDPVLSLDELMRIQAMVERVRVSDDILAYIMRLVGATRESRHLTLGVSTRGAIFLKRAAMALALTEGRGYVIPDDVKALVIPVFAHRVVLSSSIGSLGGRSREARVILSDILQFVDVPL